MESCGTELADAANVPEALAALMRHVATNLEAHARWVGTRTPEAAREHEGLTRVAADYRAIANAALRTATTMRGLRNLAPAPHDPEAWDREAFAHWMRKKVELQRVLARLLLEHADASEAAG